MAYDQASIDRKLSQSTTEPYSPIADIRWVRKVVDLTKQSIREIFNEGLALEYREAHINGQRKSLKLCKDCTAI